jgi:2-keto-3-deoxy-L-rhamnonate aldolase RhmA
LAAFRWQAPEGYHTFADNNVMVIVIVEEERAVGQVEEIAATPGVDVIFVGTSDLSFSMGLRGQSGHPRVQEALKRVVAAGKANNKFLGLMARGAQQLLEPLGRATDALQKGMLY